MHIREIEERDNAQVEALVRTCLLEFGADKPGCAWTDPDLGRFYQIYHREGARYWVAEESGQIAGGCGIAPLGGVTGVCELQKMYCRKEARGTGLAARLLALALGFAEKRYRRCYLETFENMAAANRFYVKYGFVPLPGPLGRTGHYACDRWYIKDLPGAKEKEPTT